MPPRASNHPSRHVRTEARLRAAQRKIIHGRLAVADRDALLAELYGRGYTQRMLAELLNEELEAVDLPHMTEVAVYKAIRGQRAAAG